MSPWQKEMTTTYAYEVLWQCDFAVASEQRYEQGQFENQDGIEIYSAVQGILTAAASISKLLWVTIPSENPRASGLSDEAYAVQRSHDWPTSEQRAGWEADRERNDDFTARLEAASAILAHLGMNEDGQPNL